MVPNDTQMVAAIANAAPGSLPMLVSEPLTPNSTASAPTATTIAITRSNEILSPSSGQASSDTHTGLVEPSTAASPALSHNRARPMRPAQAPTDSTEIANSRSQSCRGTLSGSPKATAISANAAAPSKPLTPRI